MQTFDSTLETTTHHVNSVDATIGQPMVARVQARILELETLLTERPADDRHGDITHALDSIDGLLTGDLTNVPAVVVSEMSRWLESTRHVAESAGVPIPMDELETGPVRVKASVEIASVEIAYELALVPMLASDPLLATDATDGM